MGEALGRGLPGAEVAASTKTSRSAQGATQRTGIVIRTSNLEVAEIRKFLIIATKPYQVAQVVSDIKPALTQDHLIISIAAAVTTQAIFDQIEGVCSVIRAPALIGLGITALAPHQSASELQLAQAEAIFAAVGRTVVVAEGLMDGVTGLSGCGPAYVYMIIEALSEAGVMVGIPRKTAILLAAQTILGATYMVLECGEHPAALKDEVTTPAGCTIDGLMQLEAGKLRATLIRAEMAATERSKSLARPRP